MKIERQISESLKGLERVGLVSDKMRRSLTPTFSTPPQIYGLPKIHKEGTPLRPIVSSIGSPTYKLAKELTRILSPLTGNTETHVKNSEAFVEVIRKEPVRRGEWMISFGVVSLFTKVPVDEALQVISSLLTNDDTLDERTSIPATDICCLMELCLRATYFQFEEMFFEQIVGAAMGSPLSPIVANIYMERFEREMLESAPEKPTMWIRYVDDTFVLWPHGDEKLEQFHQHLNNQHPQIQFTLLL